MSDTVTTSESESPEPVEACPTPLAWQQVILQTHDDVESWSDGEPDSRALTCHAVGRGPAIVLLPQIQGGPEQLYLIAHLLKEDFRCIVLSWPERLKGALSDLASRVADCIDQNTDGHGIVYGTGWGGQVAMQLAIAHPDRVSRLILTGTYLRRRLGLAERAALTASRVLPARLGILPGQPVLENRNHSPWFPPFDGTRFQFYLENVQATKIASLADRAKMMHRTDLTEHIGQLSAATLLVRTEGEGALVQDFMQELESRLPTPTIEWLHSTGLLPHLTHPHRLNKLIRSFVDGE